ncbi:hypothetical protein FRC12_024523 [Ceratobasidium sp. 428]|nr:hypothetical protein FRC12_024523 [Ceratobasidium sp. 428]
MSDNLPRRIPPEWFFSDRLFPPPPQPGERRLYLPLDLQTTERQKKLWRTEDRRRSCEAMANPTWIPNYSFAKHQRLADQRLLKPNELGWQQGPLIELSDETATVVTGAKDGTADLVYIPRLIYGSSLTNFTQSKREHMSFDIPQPQQPNLNRGHGTVRPRNAGDVHRYDLVISGGHQVEPSDLSSTLAKWLHLTD